MTVWVLLIRLLCGKSNTDNYHKGAEHVGSGMNGIAYHCPRMCDNSRKQLNQRQRHITDDCYYRNPVCYPLKFGFGYCCSCCLFFHISYLQKFKITLWHRFLWTDYRFPEKRYKKTPTKSVLASTVPWMLRPTVTL